MFADKAAGFGDLEHFQKYVQLLYKTERVFIRAVLYGSCAWAAARVLAVTQLMESFSSREVQEADSVDLKYMATVSA